MYNNPNGFRGGQGRDGYNGRGLRPVGRYAGAGGRPSGFGVSATPNGGGGRYSHARAPPRGNAPQPRGQPRLMALTAYADAHQVWMGDLDPRWDERAISDIWSSVGLTAAAVKILRSDPAKPAYSFVTFGSQEEVATAMQRNGLPVPGTSKVFRLNWATGAGGGGSGGGSGAGPLADRRHASPAADEYLTVYVGGLAPQVTQLQLFELFEARLPGLVKTARIATDAATNVSRGFGFVRLATLQAQQRAIRELNGAVVAGGAIKVSATSAQGVPPVAPARGDLLSIALAQPQPALSALTDPYNTTLCISGAAASVSTATLRQWLVGFGDIVYLRRHEHQVYVCYLSRRAAEQALLVCHQLEFHRCRLQVTWSLGSRDGDSKPYKPREATPPQYGMLTATGVVGHLCFDELSMLAISSMELSEPLPVEEVNRVYVAHKARAYELV